MVDESGLMNIVNMEPSAARLIKNTAMKTVISMTALPQKSKQNPNKNARIPNTIL